jgi:hypothetical protein
MKTNGERKSMNVAIRRGLVGVFLWGFLATVLAVRAVSDETGPISTVGQPQIVVSTVDEGGSVSSTPLPEPSPVPAPVARVSACCVPNVESGPSVCRNMMTPSACAAAGGLTVKSCQQMCPFFLAPAGTEGETGESSPNTTD